MRLLLTFALCAMPVFAADGDKKPEGEKKPAGPQIGHMVFFKLKSPSPENREKLVAACKKYLSVQDGIAYFSAGVIGDDFKRDVNDREWDVALHLVFTNKATHDKYQDDAEHKKFIEENKEGWEKVRVFDSEVVPMKRKEGMKKGEPEKPGVKKAEGDNPGVKKPDGDKPGVKKPDGEK